MFRRHELRWLAGLLAHNHNLAPVHQHYSVVLVEALDVLFYEFGPGLTCCIGSLPYSFEIPVFELCPRSMFEAGQDVAHVVEAETPGLKQRAKRHVHCAARLVLQPSFVAAPAPHDLGMEQHLRPQAIGKSTQVLIQRKGGKRMRSVIKFDQQRRTIRAPLPALLLVRQVRGAWQAQNAVDILRTWLGAEPQHHPFDAGFHVVDLRLSFLGIGKPGFAPVIRNSLWRGENDRHLKPP